MNYANFIVEVTLDGKDEGFYACPDTWVHFDHNGVANFLSEPPEDDDGTDSPLHNGIPDDWIFLDHDSDDAYRILALMMAIDEWDIASFCTVSDKHKTVSLGHRREWIVATDSEADDLWDEQLDSYLDECVLAELPDTAATYFDRDRWKDDARHDGRAHVLGRYDGSELTAETQEGTYYVYRLN